MIVGKNFRRKPGWLGAEEQYIVGPILHLGVPGFGVGGEREHPLWLQRIPGSFEVLVHRYRRQVVIVEPRTPQLRLGEIEPEWFDQM